MYIVTSKPKRRSWYWGGVQIIVVSWVVDVEIDDHSTAKAMPIRALAARLLANPERRAMCKA
jgi:hypothetical protein